MDLSIFPDSKTGAKPIYLNTPALEVLANLPRSRRQPARHRGSLGWLGADRIYKSRGVASVTPLDCATFEIHDLRHSFASTGANMGEGLPIIGRLLGHRHTATTARYSHFAADPLRAANEKIGARIIAAMAGGESALVVPLRPKATA